MITQILMVVAMISMLSSGLVPGLWMSNYDEKKDSLNDYENGKNSIL